MFETSAQSGAGNDVAAAAAAVASGSPLDTVVPADVLAKPGFYFVVSAAVLAWHNRGAVLSWFNKLRGKGA